MSEEFNLRFKLSLENSNVVSDTLKRAERDAKSFGSTLSNALKGAGKDIAAFGYATGKSLASLATGNLGIAAQAKSVLQLRDSISALAVMAGKGADAVEPLRQQIHAISTASNQMQSDVVDALSAFTERTGDIETARRNMELYGKAATATGTSLQDIAYVGAELSSKLNIKDQANAFAILATQSKAGSIELRDLATKGPKIFAAAANYGLTGEQGVRSAGAMAQIVATSFGGKGSAASVATSIENIFASIAKKTGAIEGAGIKVKGRDPIEVMFDIIRKTGGDVNALQQSKIFTMQGMRGVTAFARMYKDTGGFGAYESIRDVKAGDVLDRDFAARRGTGAAALNASQISVAKSIDDKVGPAFERLALHADKLAGAFKWATEHMTATLAIVGGGMVAKGVLSRVLSGAGGGIAGRLLGAAGVSGGGTPVFVTNWPGGSTFGGAGGGVAGGAAASWGKRALGAAGAVAAPLAVIAGGAYAIQALTDKGDLIDQLNAPEEARRRRRASVIRRGGDMVTANPRQSLGDLDEALKADRAEIDKLNLTVNINGDSATAEAEGTRSPEVMIRRGVRGEYFQGGRMGR
jgi:chemotaxis protein CheY-P-specific phosphatase CheC